VSEHVHDLVGIGAGPFGLGLACLLEPLDVDAVFLEARDDVAWHPGMMLDDATLQVPFLADLVTMADPTSRWSYLAHLKETGQLYPFYVRESFYPLRREFDAYLRWAAHGVGSVRFGQDVVEVTHDGTAYAVTTAAGETVRGRRIALGVGTSPRVPEPLAHLLGTSAGDTQGPVLHTADYLTRREELLGLRSITIVGSGQSAAEVYRDLLLAAPDHDYELTWLTRSPRFFPMEYTKLTLELTSPEYSAYFQALPAGTRERVLRDQRSLYKGISGDVVNDISDLHYQQQVAGQGPRTTLVTGAEVTGGRLLPGDPSGGVELDLHHAETGEDFGVTSEGLVLATGYAATTPAFLDPVLDRLLTDERGRLLASPTYAVDDPAVRTVPGGEVFVMNGEEHTHGFVAPDLGMGAHRASVVIAAITGREVYPVEKRVMVQSFGVPDHLRRTPSSEAS